MGKSKDPNKSTLKTTFKAVQIQRIPSAGEQPGHFLLMHYITKEKKQKSKLLFECENSDEVNRSISETITMLPTNSY